MADGGLAPSRIRLSGIVITKNEAHNLHACLESLSFCDEIVVVDSGSTDGTQEIARHHGARLIERDWPGYGPQKEFARREARGEWVLSLDADERVTPALREEILAALASPAFDAYEMPRLSTFLGRPMRHSGWWPDYCLRLFRKDVGSFPDVLVHESVKTSAAVGRFAGHIDHHTVQSLDDLFRKSDQYSTLGAQMVLKRGRRVRITTPVLRSMATFLKMYVLKRGFLDGPEGFFNACVQSQTVFWKYGKAWAAQRSAGNRTEAD